MEDIDVALMLRFKEGDMSAFDEIVQRHKRSLINFFNRFLWDKQLAEDSAQEVFIKLYKSVKRYKPKSKFNTFLYSIARNHFRDILRKNERNPQLVSLDEPLTYEDCETSTLQDKIADKELSPSEEFEKREIQDIIKKAILSLPVGLREVFILREYQGLKNEEVAKILKIPVGTVKSRMHDGIRLLRIKLKWS